MRNEKQSAQSGISLDSLLLAVFGFLHLYRYPSFFFPRVKTFIDYLPSGVKKLIGDPSQDVVTNPVARLLVTIGTIIIILYLLTDLLMKSSRKTTLKTIILSVFILQSVALPVLYESGRFITTRDQLYGHDGGVIQTQIALDYLTRGINPYTENYQGTIMDDGYDPNDPPLFHLPYLPFVLIFALPIRAFFMSVTGVFDMRFIYLASYLMCFPLLWRFSRQDTDKLTLCILFGLNPLLTQFIVQGRNDIFCIFWILLSLYWLLQRKTPFLGLIALSLACAVKPFAWLIVPFVLMYLWDYLSKADSLENPKVIEIIRSFVIRSTPLWLPCILIIGPFIIWDFHALWDDVFLFNAGRSEINYAFGGTPGVGFPNIILYFGWIKSLQDYFPLWPFQLIFGGGIFIYFMRYQRGVNTLRSVVTGFSVTLLIYLFFARLFHDNYLGFLGCFFAIAAMGDRLGESKLEE